jgi:hypothetical protein
MQIRPLRPPLLAAALALLAGCNSARDLDEAVVPLGDFYFGHNIVVAENAVQGPLSREAAPEEWEEVLRAEMDRRFRRFDGDRLYHLAIGVEGYVLAMPGIPVVAAPKSALIFSVTVWDDAAGGKINETPHRITVLETLGGDSVVGSGLTRSREEQMQDLAQNGARSVENWLRENIDWFGGAAEEAIGEADDGATGEDVGDGAALVAGGAAGTPPSATATEIVTEVLDPAG